MPNQRKRDGRVAQVSSMPAVKDPVLVALVQGALSNIQLEMTSTIMRSGRSNVCTIARDYSNAIFDSDNDMIIQGQDIPVHLGSLIFGLKAVAKHYAGKVSPGDVLYHNEPSMGGSHIADMCAYKPIFIDSELAFWSVSKLHVADAGGPVPGSYNKDATEIYGEGLRVPPIRLVNRGEMDDNLLRLILLNVRTSENWAGDLHAQLGAVGVAERRMQALCAKYGLAAVREATQSLKDLAANQMRELISRTPDGVGVAKTTIEDMGHGFGEVEIIVKAVVEGDALRIELASPKQLPYYTNSYESNSISSVYLGVIMWAQLPPPYNEGLYRNITVDCGPKGSLTNAEPPAPCMFSTSIPCENIAYATFQALSKLMARRAMGEWGRTYAAHIAGIDPRNGTYWVQNVLPTEISGAGAIDGLMDGWHTVGPGNCLGAITSGDTELTEQVYPMVIHEYSIREDSGGAGKWRGGCGSTYVIEPLGEMFVNAFGQGLLAPSQGVMGAADVLADRKVARGAIIYEDGKKEVLTANKMFTLRSGQLYVSVNPGGGGAGNPFERGTESVVDDVRNHRVSIEGAAVEYGVVIEPAGLAVDLKGTDRLRSERSQKQPSASVKGAHS